MKAYIVLTTINVPTIAEDYYKNFKKFGHLKNIGMIIVGDNKSSDKESFSITKKLQKKGFDVEYFDIKKQEKWMKQYPKLKKIIPYNNDSRRNVGFLMAIQRKCDFIISIDDDNFPRDADCYKDHAIVGQRKKLAVVSTSNDWFNPCDMLSNDMSAKLYARGHPYNKRYQNEIVKEKKKDVLVGVNCGLWLHEPDVDAITRISTPAKTMDLKYERKVLDKNCYAPINTQNTALVYDLIPAYYFVLMEGFVNHMPLARFGDIWTGWFLKKVADHLGYYVSVGKPVSDHRRNIHNLINDLYKEFISIQYNDAFTQIIRDLDAKGKTCVDVYADISKKFNKEVKKSKFFPDEFKKYSDKLYKHQHIWLDVAVKLM